MPYTARSYVWLCLLVLLLSACTGTSEQSPETLLVVANRAADDDAAHIALLRSSTLSSLIPAEQRRLEARTALPANPIAYDLRSRANRRDSLVVLSRERAELGILSFFDVADLDPENLPDRLERLRPDVRLELSTLAIDSNNVSVAPEGLCPVALQVSATGRYLALLSDSQLSGCNVISNSAISILDMGSSPGATPTLVFHEETFPIFSRSFYMLQAEDNDRLFYFRESTGDPDMRVVRLSQARVDNGDLASERVALLTNSDAIVDIAPLGNSLVLLQNSQFVAINSFAESPQVQEAISSSSGSRRIIRNDFAKPPLRLYTLSSNRFSIHRSLSDDAPQSINLSAQDGTLESINDFLYLVDRERVIRFDVLTYDGGSLNNSAFLSLNTPELRDPVFVTWIEARLEALANAR